MRLNLLNREQFTATRLVPEDKGYYTSGGKYIEGVPTEPSEFTFKGSLQPVSGSDMKLLSGGFKHTNTKKIYTKTKLNTVNEDTHTDADLVYIDGIPYQVQNVEHWRSGYRLNHYKALLTKVEKSND